MDLEAAFDTLPGLTERAAQRRMAAAVAAALEDQVPLLVHAPTGVGKSLGYLVPIVAAGRRAIVATATKALQSQLIERDLPRLAEAFGTTSALAMGRANYACLARMDALVAATRLAATANEEAALEVAAWAVESPTGSRLDAPPGVRDDVWDLVSTSGEDCPGQKGCAFHPRCFAERAREQAREVDVVVTNHHLLLLELELRAMADAPGVMLPEVDVIVIDEAHRLADHAADLYGVTVTAARMGRAGAAADAAAKAAGLRTDWSRRLRGRFQELAADLSPGPILPGGRAHATLAAALTPLTGDIQSIVATLKDLDDPDDEAAALLAARRRLRVLSRDLERLATPPAREQAGPHRPGGGGPRAGPVGTDPGPPGRHGSGVVPNTSDPHRPADGASRVGRGAGDLEPVERDESRAGGAEGEPDRAGGDGSRAGAGEGEPGRTGEDGSRGGGPGGEPGRAGEDGSRVGGGGGESDQVGGERGRGSRTAGAPPDLAVWVEEGRGGGRVVRSALVEPGPVLEAVLWDRVPVAVACSATLAVAGSLEVAARTLGVGDPATVVAASPFDFRRNALLYVPRAMPPPSSASFQAAAERELVALVGASRGRALVLCTSWRAVESFAGALADLPYELLVQGDDVPARLAARFRDEVASVLVATRTFFEGFDVPGESLSLLVLDRLPFPRPDDPLLAERGRRVEMSGRSRFSEVWLPAAAVSLQQALGRLVRSETDRGVMAVLDRRLADAGYRAPLLASLPPARLTRSMDEVRAFLAV